MAVPGNLAVEPFLGGFILETLTIGMYGEGRNALREYVQNAYDSIQKAIGSKQLSPGQGLIQVTIAPGMDGLTIRDNGAGLGVARAAKTLIAIGASTKDYRRNAGFRGIGRLAGIAFSNKVVFTTKATGETQSTQVTFDAKKMREMMAPERGSSTSAMQLIIDCVTIEAVPSPSTDPAFFQVELQGFESPPDECSDAKLLARYLGQVAPVPYRPEFEFASEIRDAAARHGLPIEEVKLTVEAPGHDPVQVFKPFVMKYEVGNAADPVVLTDWKPHHSPTKRWWGWMGMKDVPGQYLDADIRGIRIRVKNIQIDGEDIVRSIFHSRSASSARYQDWFVGEIFVDPETLTPNARRDGFEDTPAWREVQKEIGDSIGREAGRSAQDISNKGQLTEEKLADRTEKIELAIVKERSNGFSVQDRALAISFETTKAHADIAKALKNAEPATSAALQQLAARVLDAKNEALSHVGAISQKLDRERIEHDARQLLLGELLAVFEDRLEIPCLASVRDVLRTEYNYPPD